MWGCTIEANKFVFGDFRSRVWWAVVEAKNERLSVQSSRSVNDTNQSTTKETNTTRGRSFHGKRDACPPYKPAVPNLPQVHHHGHGARIHSFHPLPLHPHSASCPRPHFLDTPLPLPSAFSQNHQSCQASWLGRKKNWLQPCGAVCSLAQMNATYAARESPSTETANSIPGSIHQLRLPSARPKNRLDLGRL
jgi:hypothetical protein